MENSAQSLKQFWIAAQPKFRGRSVTEFLIHWSGTLPEDNTWEKAWKLKAQYPHLVDKVL